MKDGQLFHILTYGQGSMADFAGQLSPEQRWDAINFVRTMQAGGPLESDSVGGGDGASGVAQGDGTKTPPNDAANDDRPQE